VETECQLETMFITNLIRFREGFGLDSVVVMTWGKFSPSRLAGNEGVRETT
jgi:hypothetical protein